MASNRRAKPVIAPAGAGSARGPQYSEGGKLNKVKKNEVKRKNTK